MRDESRLWYGWVVLAVVFLVMITLIAFRATIGPFFKEISGEFGWSRGATAAAFSIGMLAQAIISPLAGISLRSLEHTGVDVGGGCGVRPLACSSGAKSHRSGIFT